MVSLNSSRKLSGPSLLYPMRSPQTGSRRTILDLVHGNPKVLVADTPRQQRWSSAARPRALTQAHLDASGRKKMRRQTTERRKSTATILPYLSRRSSAIAMDLSAELKLVKRTIFALKPWRDAFQIMKLVFLNSLIGTLFGWGAAALYAFGGMSTTQVAASHDASSPSSSSASALFLAWTAFAYTLTASLGSLWLIAFTTAKAPFAARSTHLLVQPMSVKLLLFRLLRRSWHVLLLCLGCMLSLLALCNHLKTSLLNDSSTHVHVYIVVIIAGLYCFFVLEKVHSQQQPRVVVARGVVSSKVQVALSTSNSQSSIDSLESAASHCPPSDHPRRWQAFQPSLRDRWAPFLGFSTALLYLHVSSALITDSEHWRSLLYACGSFCLKVAMQEAVKHFQLCGRNAPALIIHLALTVPTIAIDTQIRLVFLCLSARQSLLATSAVIVCCKVLFRLAKIFRLRNAITSRLTQCKSMDAIFQCRKRQKTLQPCDLDTARAEYADFMAWKAYVLKLHASEVFADMHGEYVSNGCSVAVVFFLSGHANYNLSRLSVGTSVEKQVIAAVVQVASGLLCDWVLSLIETVHEVPLYEAIFDDGRWLLTFLRALLAVLAAVNVGVIALFSVET